MNCPNCNSDLNGEEDFCPHCGAAISEPAKRGLRGRPISNETVTLILFVVLGIPAGVLGACSTYGALFPKPDDRIDEARGLTLSIAIPTVLLFVLLLREVLKMRKRS